MPELYIIFSILIFKIKGKKLIFYLFFIFIFFLILLLRIGYLTLVERYFLAISQIRVSRNKVSFLGIFQIVFDGLKLIMHEKIFILTSNIKFFVFTPLLRFYLILFFYFLLDYYYNFINLDYTIIFILYFIGLIILLLLIVSFFSKSKYGFLGSLRSLRSGLSFDVVFIVFVFYLIFFLKSFIVNYFWGILFNFYFFVIFFLIILVELNRAPFDFSEGESELVRGYNIELGRLLFVFFFLTEYGLLIFYSQIIIILFFNNNFICGFIVFTGLIFIRSVFPRFRYDYLIVLCWVTILPVFLFYFYYLVL